METLTFSPLLTLAHFLDSAPLTEQNLFEAVTVLLEDDRVQTGGVRENVERCRAVLLDGSCPGWEEGEQFQKIGAERMIELNALRAIVAFFSSHLAGWMELVGSILDEEWDRCSRTGDVSEIHPWGPDEGGPKVKAIATVYEGLFRSIQVTYLIHADWIEAVTWDAVPTAIAEMAGMPPSAGSFPVRFFGDTDPFGLLTDTYRSGKRPFDVWAGLSWHANRPLPPPINRLDQVFEAAQSIEKECDDSNSGRACFFSPFSILNSIPIREDTQPTEYSDHIRVHFGFHSSLGLHPLLDAWKIHKRVRDGALRHSPGMALNDIYSAWMMKKCSMWAYSLPGNMCR